jgi:hypothetical protein
MKKIIMLAIMLLLTSTVMAAQPTVGIIGKYPTTGGPIKGYQIHGKLMGDDVSFSTTRLFWRHWEPQELIGFEIREIFNLQKGWGTNENPKIYIIWVEIFNIYNDKRQISRSDEIVIEVSSEEDGPVIEPPGDPEIIIMERPGKPTISIVSPDII